MNWDIEVDRLGPPLLRYFLSSFSRQVADELVQETIIRLVRKVETGGYDPGQGTLIKFAYGIARYVRLETLKALPPEIPSEHPDKTADGAAVPVDEAYDTQSRIGNLRRALLQLPEVQREVLVLSLDEELSLPEISEILGLPVGTVKSHVHRAKVLLGEIMVKKKDRK